MIEIGPLVLLRPAWLLGWLLLPLLWRWWRPAAVGGGDWERVIAPRLRPLLLGGQARQAARSLLRPLLLALLALALLAAAGPAWDRQPLPLARSGQAKVAVFDLSPSMGAADLRPDRLTRARYKLIDWLSRQRDGQIGLVVFGGQAFAVAPLTTDARTLRHLAEVLEPELMPVAGARADLGLAKAVELLDGAGAIGGEILLITDGINRRAEAMLPELRARGIAVSVLAVGTAAGAPVPQPGGGFLTDSRGDIVLPRLDQDRLAGFAGSGGGRYATLSVDDSDLQRLDPAANGEPLRSGDEQAQRESEHWRDRGPWLLLACLPLAALLFRRGWLLALPLALSLGLAPSAPLQAQPAAEDARAVEAPPAPLEGWRWQDLWLRRDQQAARALAADQPALAESLAPDPTWAGAAAAAAQDYARAATHFGEGSDATARYNQGTALAQAGQYQPALEALREALALDPQHADARANLEAIEDWLRQQQQQSGQSQDQEPSQSQDESSEQQSGEQQPSGNQEQQGDSGGQPGEQQDSSENESQGQPDQSQEQPSGEGASDPQSGTGEESDPPAEPEAEPAAGEEAEQQSQESAHSADGEDPQGSEVEAGKQASGSQGEDAEPIEGPAPQLAGELGPEEAERERQQALEQWLRRVPDDPGGLLRRKFQLESRRRGQDQDAQDEDSEW